MPARNRQKSAQEHALRELNSHFGRQSAHQELKAACEQAVNWIFGMGPKPQGGFTPFQKRKINDAVNYGIEHAYGAKETHEVHEAKRRLGSLCR